MNTTTDESAVDLDDTNTIGNLLHRGVLRNPSATALSFEDRSWTYQQLLVAVDQVATKLQELELPAGSRVAAFAANSDIYAILFLACAKAGLIHVPVNFALKGEELRYILQDSGACLVITDEPRHQLVQDLIDRQELPEVRDIWPFFPTASAIQSVFDIAMAQENYQPFADIGLVSADLVQLLYTSGTTSAPKGAMMTHGALIAQYVSAIIALDLETEDRPLIAMPLYHSAAMHVFLLPYLALGASIRLLAKPDIAEILQRVEDERIGSLFLAPTVWVPLSNHPDLPTRDLSSLTKAQYGASIMPVTVLSRLRERYPDIGFYNCFGQSELGPLCSVLRPEEHDARPASCGRPVFFVEARVINSAGQLADDGEPGEIQYRSPQVMRGYWNKPEQTKEAFVDGWFRSGDQVVKDPEGYIQVVDRIKDVINTGGILVAPREVEDCIYELPEVAEVAVVGVADERWIEAITAIVVLKEGAMLSAQAIQDHVKLKLANYKVPKRVDFVAQLPRNQSGKLLKRQLRAERSNREE